MEKTRLLFSAGKGSRSENVKETDKQSKTLANSSGGGAPKQLLGRKKGKTKRKREKEKGEVEGGEERETGEKEEGKEEGERERQAHVRMPCLGLESSTGLFPGSTALSLW